MRKLIPFVALMVVGGVARGQERIDPETAKKHAKLMVEATKDATDLPIKTEVDPEKPYGVKSGNHGVMVLPDKALSDEVIAKAGADAIPVGQLWMHHLTPVIDGQPVDGEKLRIVNINVGGEEHKLPMCLLALKKKAAGEWELLVYGKDKEPLTRLAVKKMEGTQELPIELDGKKNENDTGDLTLKIVGKVQATLTVGAKDD